MTPENPPEQPTPPFIRIRISAQYTESLERLQTLLNQRSPSRTVEYILSAYLETEIKKQRKLRGEDNVD